MTRPTETTTKPANVGATVKPSTPPAAQPLQVIEAKIINDKKLAREYGRIKSNDDLHWAQEKQFFMSIVQKSDKLMTATIASLRDSFLQAASLGLSFNPQRGHVYLIPRKDNSKNPPVLNAYASPGYRGLIHLAILGGAVKLARAEVVYAKDHFRYRGPTEKVEFEAGGVGSGGTFNAFNVKRGEKVGVFCEAQLVDGTWMSDMMDAETIKRIKAKSEFPSSMLWTTFEEEGWKKAILRRAYKTWPGATNAALFNRAIELLNEHEGIDTRHAIDGKAETVTTVSESHVNELHAILTDNGYASEKADRQLERLAKTFGRTKISELPVGDFAAARDKLKEKMPERQSNRGDDAADTGAT